MILFTFIAGMIGSFQVFTPAYVIAGGTQQRADYSSMFYVLYLFAPFLNTSAIGSVWQRRNLDPVHHHYDLDNVDVLGIAALCMKYEADEEGTI